MNSPKTEVANRHTSLKCTTLWKDGRPIVHNSCLSADGELSASFCREYLHASAIQFAWIVVKGYRNWKSPLQAFVGCCAPRDTTLAGLSYLLSDRCRSVDCGGIRCNLAQLEARSRKRVDLSVSRIYVRHVSQRVRPAPARHNPFRVLYARRDYGRYYKSANYHIVAG
jgi:hypothetical protein